MSKSTGNLIFVKDLLARHEAMVLRLAVMSQHYRTTSWEWAEELLDAAADRLHLWRSAASDDRTPDEALVAAVRSHLDNDLDVPNALAVIDEGARSGSDVSAAASLLGVALEGADAQVGLEMSVR